MFHSTVFSDDNSRMCNCFASRKVRKCSGKIECFFNALNVFKAKKIYNAELIFINPRDAVQLRITLALSALYRFLYSRLRDCVYFLSVEKFFISVYWCFYIYFLPEQFHTFCIPKVYRLLLALLAIAKTIQLCGANTQEIILYPYSFHTFEFYRELLYTTST